jgi:hypothetical protein
MPQSSAGFLLSHNLNIRRYWCCEGITRFLIILTNLSVELLNICPNLEQPLILLHNVPNILGLALRFKPIAYCLAVPDTIHEIIGQIV